MKFTYNGQSTDDFNVLVASFDFTDELTSGLTKEVIRSEFNTVNSIPNHMGTKYSEPITFTRVLVKNPNNDELEPFTEMEIRNIVKWLTSPKVPMDLLVNKSCNNTEKTYLYKGLFTDIKYKVANGIVGIIFTFTNNSPFLYEIKEDIKTIEEETTWNYVCDSDEAYEYSYPKMEITYTGESDSTTLSLTNITDNNKSFSIVLTKDNTITIDSKKQIITNIDNSLKFTDFMDENGQVYWLRLVDGMNELNISSDNYPCEIKITNNEIRKAGELYEY